MSRRLRVTMRSLGGAVALAALVACTGGGSGGDEMDEGTDTDSDDGPGDEGGDTDGDPPAAFEPGPPAMRRLVAFQYRNTIADLLGPEIADRVTGPEDIPISGLATVGAAQIVVGETAIAQYEEAAIVAVNAMFEDLDRVDAVVGCVPVADDDDICRRSYIEGFGRRAFRRPLTNDEIDLYIALHDDGRAEFDTFYGGVILVVGAMLQSPKFLYMTEVGEPDPENPGWNRLTGYEMASRLSFFLTGTTPSDGLLDAAEAGALDTDAGARDVAEQLVQTSGAPAALEEYYAEILRLSELDNLVKVPSEFPGLGVDLDEPSSLTPDFAVSARGETLAFLRDVIWDRDADFREVLTADYTLVNPLMEFFYFGTPLVEGADLTAYRRVELPPEQGRSGILGHVSLLSTLARSTRTAPTLRGKFIREVILCDTIPPPPDDVSFELPGDTEAPTMREKLVEHQQNPACAGCHVVMDNLGFALEDYDGMGFYRTVENGFPIDARGEDAEFGTFDGAQELGALLSQSPKIPACAVKKLFRHASGHIETQGEQPELDALAERFVSSEHRVQALLVDIASSPAFRYVAAQD